MAPKAAANPMMEKMHKALALQKAGDFAKAQKLYKLVLKKLPDNADANHLYGVSFRQLGDPHSAIKYIEKAIALSPKQGVFYSNLARAHSDIVSSGPEVILENAEKALALNPNIVEAYNLKAIALTKLERPEEAEEVFKFLISRVPNYADANSNYGLLLRDQKRFKEAVEFFDAAVRLDPKNPENYVQRARARLELVEFEACESELEAALKLFPDRDDLSHEMARVLFKMGEALRALPFIETAATAKPSDPHRQVTLGVVYQAIGRFAESVDCFKTAMKLADMNLPTADWNLSLSYFAMGDFENGWRYADARFRDKIASVLCREFDVPEWDGSAIPDKSLMVWTDQGIGDVLRNVSMLKEAQGLSGHLIAEVPVKLQKLVQSNFPGITVRPGKFNHLTKQQEAHDYDLQCCMADLGKYFRRNAGDFKKAEHPYLGFDKGLAREYMARIPNPEGKPIVGISWRSKALATWRARWYLSILQLSPVLRTPDVIFVNLQYAALQKELLWARDALGVEIHDWDDIDLMDDLNAAAALTACVDLVVTANSSVGDLAGALAVPCWRFGSINSVVLMGQQNPPWFSNTTYYRIQPDERSSDIVPRLLVDLENWAKTSTPDERLKRLGL
ncbi:tetratricopeptide repeat protein [Roseibium suaedae]|uniref:Tetratricopeptide repeat-containing protein n=1 Tax=Roseibium suaedae TaxID=735517 RepID=A0A1M7D4W3_9HYPH|nr:tetratricopeptide repeat protein [Roseibium suaedae]SHL74542.1 Tetratricopeptide repeat-containing protein [Roseibium suaedae]